jgi:hypothetical protein
MHDWILIRVYLIINHEKQIDFTLREIIFLFIDFHFFYLVFNYKRLT